ncbi:MAG: extracellular solute-binding protein [Vallitaleaceae bacterium]|jgi:raffinose/stachyose/melibiose transport system substrate-binding protein|nr:extracellular solute-binding protein [Vallitaleaceae bacterium]
MKNYAKRLLALLLVTLMVFSLVACNDEVDDAATTSPDTGTVADVADADSDSNADMTEEKITLTIYAQYSDEDTKVPYDYAVAELAKEYPNVELELIVQAQDDGLTIQTYAATGDLPDIFQVGLAQINAFKESGNILVLDDYVESTGFGEALVPSATNLLWNEDGHAYAFPYAGNELVLLFYNKAVFAANGVEVPETYEDLVNAIEVFNANDIVPLSIFAKEGWITTALYDVFATRMAPEGIVALDNGTALASDGAYLEAAERLEELVDLGLVAEGATNMNYDQAASLFYEGGAAMFLNGQWEIQGSTDALGDDVDWMWYPVYSENSEAAHALSGGGAPGGYAVSPYSEHVDLAAEVAAFISQKYCEAKFLYRANPLLACKVAEGLEPEVAFPPMMEKLAAELNNITSTTVFSWGLNNPIFKVTLEEQSQFLLTRGYTAAEFVVEMDKAIEADQ